MKKTSSLKAALISIHADFSTLFVDGNLFGLASFLTAFGVDGEQHRVVGDGAPVVLFFR